MYLSGGNDEMLAKFDNMVKEHARMWGAAVIVLAVICLLLVVFMMYKNKSGFASGSEALVLQQQDSSLLSRFNGGKQICGPIDQVPYYDLKPTNQPNVFDGQDADGKYRVGDSGARWYMILDSNGQQVVDGCGYYQYMTKQLAGWNAVHDLGSDPSVGQLLDQKWNLDSLTQYAKGCVVENPDAGDLAGWENAQVRAPGGDPYKDNMRVGSKKSYLAASPQVGTKYSDADLINKARR